MTYSYKLLPGEPILILTIHDTFDLENDIDASDKESASILDSVEQPVYYIADVRNMPPLVFQDFLVATNRSFRGEQAVFNHPNVKTTIIVSNENLAKLAAKGLDSEAFGNVSVPVYDNLDDALDHARMLIAQEQL